MKCELCKKNDAHPRMFIETYDINGIEKHNVCQLCLKKIKNGFKDKKPQDVEIHPAK